MVVRRLGQVELADRMLRTCFSTVPSVTHSARAMPALDRPSAICASTSRSRGVSAASGSTTCRAWTSSCTSAGSTTEPPAATRPSVSMNSSRSVTRRLEQVADAAPAGQQLHRVLDLGVRRQDEDADVRVLGADRPRGVEALRRVRRRHPDVDEHEVGRRLADESQQLRRVPRLPDHGEARALEHAREPFPEEEVIIGHDDARRRHRHAILTSLDRYGEMTGRRPRAAAPRCCWRVVTRWRRCSSAVVEEAGDALGTRRDVAGARRARRSPLRVWPAGRTPPDGWRCQRARSSSTASPGARSWARPIRFPEGVASSLAGVRRAGRGGAVAVRARGVA